MSKKHAEEFHGRLKTDKQFRAKVHKASEEILEIAKQHDLHFTREELVEVMRDRWKKQGSSKPGEADPDTFVSERPRF